MKSCLCAVRDKHLKLNVGESGKFAKRLRLTEGQIIGSENFFLELLFFPVTGKSVKEV